MKELFVFNNKFTDSFSLSISHLYSLFFTFSGPAFLEKAIAANLPEYVPVSIY